MKIPKILLTTLLILLSVITIGRPMTAQGAEPKGDGVQISVKQNPFNLMERWAQPIAWGEQTPPCYATVRIVYTHLQGPARGTDAYSDSGDYFWKTETETYWHHLTDVTWDNYGGISVLAFFTPVERMYAYGKGSKWLAPPTWYVDLHQCNVSTYLELDPYPIQTRAGDVDGNNIINLVDFSRLNEAFGSQCGELEWNSQADFNNDCVVNIVDFNYLVQNYGLVGWPAPQGE